MSKMNKHKDMDAHMRKALWKSIVIGIILLLLATIIDLYIINYSVNDRAAALNSLFVLGKFALLIYIIVMILAGFVKYLNRFHDDNHLSKLTRKILENWFKWLVMTFILLAYMLLFLFARTGLM